MMEIGGESSFQKIISAYAVRSMSWQGLGHIHKTKIASIAQFRVEIFSDDITNVEVECF